MRQMATADSRRFLGFLKNRWSTIPLNFRTPMLQGAVAQALSRFGNVQYSPSHTFVEVLDKAWLCEEILDELGRHDSFWFRTSAGAEAVLACCHMAEGEALTGELLFRAAGYVYARGPECWESGDSLAINSVRGQVADGLSTLVDRLATASEAIPPALFALLGMFGVDCHPQVRAVVLTGLPRLLFDGDAQGWDLFDLVLSNQDETDWEVVERCFYASYHHHYARIESVLDRARAASGRPAQEAWGHIQALAAISGQVSAEQLMNMLLTHNTEDSWTGAIQVWVANLGQAEYADACRAGLEVAVGQPRAASGIESSVNHIFGSAVASRNLPVTFLKALLTVKSGSDSKHLPYNVDDWLVANAETRPDDALELAEAIVSEMKSGAQLHFESDSLGELLTAFFREAEDRELGDAGAMLSRVITLQDSLIELQHTNIESWLRAAERPDNA